VRVLVVGASGRLGTAVVAALGDRHEVVAASRSGEHFVDLTNSASVAGLYASVGQVDAVVCTAGKTPYGPLAELTSDQWMAGVRDKLLGQVELVRLGLPHVADGGSFTLVSGILSEQPVPTSAVASTVDGGIDAFVRSAAIELPRGIRINTVSATVFEEAWDAYGAMFPGATPIPVADAARACVESVEGDLTGQVLRVGY
jgi:NAD(P)-dependent dehydrogenase (short-subunit alcohol dehydrogenase family)